MVRKASSKELRNERGKSLETESWKRNYMQDKNKRTKIFESAKMVEGKHGTTSCEEDKVIRFTGKLGVLTSLSTNLSKVEMWVIQAAGERYQVVGGFDKS